MGPHPLSARGLESRPVAQLCLPFQDLLDPARWRMLIQQFRYDNYRLHQLGNNSVFTLTLQAGLSAIKTPYPSGLSAALRLAACVLWQLGLGHLE